MSARKEARQAPALQRIGSRWKRLMDGGADAPNGDEGKQVAACARPSAAASTPYAPTDAATSGRAMADAAGAIIDTERDG